MAKEIVTPLGDAQRWLEAVLADNMGRSVDIIGDLVQDGDDYYIDNATLYGDSATMEGSISLYGELAELIVAGVQILNADSIEELPEGLVDTNKELRNLAKERFSELYEEEEDE